MADAWIDADYVIGMNEMQDLLTNWRAYCQEHGSTLPEPKICVEQCQAVARFDELRVSAWVARIHDYDFVKCADEAEARWVPVVWDKMCVPAWTFCNRLTAILDRRIPF